MTNLNYFTNFLSTKNYLEACMIFIKQIKLFYTAD